MQIRVCYKLQHALLAVKNTIAPVSCLIEETGAFTWYLEKGCKDNYRSGSMPREPLLREIGKATETTKGYTDQMKVDPE